jgi:hypothetical protein
MRSFLMIVALVACCTTTHAAEADAFNTGLQIAEMKTGNPFNCAADLPPPNDIIDGVLCPCKVNTRTGYVENCICGEDYPDGSTRCYCGSSSVGLFSVVEGPNLAIKAPVTPKPTRAILPAILPMPMKKPEVVAYAGPCGPNGCAVQFNAAPGVVYSSGGSCASGGCSAAGYGAGPVRGGLRAAAAAPARFVANRIEGVKERHTRRQDRREARGGLFGGRFRGC